MVSKKELIDELDGMDVVKCVLDSGTTFEIGVADYWIGGSSEGFLCDFIGNVEYPTKESCVNALFNYLDKIGEIIEEVE